MLQRGRKSRAQLETLAGILERRRAVSGQIPDEDLQTLRDTYGDRAVDMALALMRPESWHSKV